MEPSSKLTEKSKRQLTIQQRKTEGTLSGTEKQDAAIGPVIREGVQKPGKH